MPIDLQRILEAAARAALEEPAQAARAVPKRKKKRRLSTGRAMLVGAGLLTAGRVVLRHQGRDVLGRVQQRLADSEWLGDWEPESVDGSEEDLADNEPDADAEEERAAEDDEEVEDASPDEDQEPEDEDEVEESESERPRGRRSGQRGHA